MRKIAVYKCPLCDFQSKTPEGFEEHMRNVHPGEFRKGGAFVDITTTYLLVELMVLAECVRKKLLGSRRLVGMLFSVDLRSVKRHSGRL